MLAIKPNCENCGKLLPNESEEAMICTFECTFCMDCVNSILENVCPNCGGGFEKRPVRPESRLAKDPSQSEPFLKPVNLEEFTYLKNKLKNIHPKDR